MRRVRIELVIDIPNDQVDIPDSDNYYEKMPTVYEIRNYAMEALEYWGKSMHPFSWQFQLKEPKNCRVTVLKVFKDR